MPVWPRWQLEALTLLSACRSRRAVVEELGSSAKQ